MFGLIQWTDQKQRRRAPLRERTVLRLRFWEADITRRDRTPSALLRRRCAAAARQLQRLGVTRAVFPEGFPHLEEFERYNIRPADPLPMYRALTGELVQAALEARGQSGRSAVVAVCADHLTAEVRQAVTALCIRNRYVLLCAPERHLLPPAPAGVRRPPGPDRRHGAAPPCGGGGAVLAKGRGISGADGAGAVSRRDAAGERSGTGGGGGTAPRWLRPASAAGRPVDGRGHPAGTGGGFAAENAGASACLTAWGHHAGITKWGRIIHRDGGPPAASRSAP